MTRWFIQFYDGPGVRLHIPTYLVGGDDDAFEWITLGMESYDWRLVLRQSSSSYLTLNRNGMIWAMESDE